MKNMLISIMVYATAMPCLIHPMQNTRSWEQKVLHTALSQRNKIIEDAAAQHIPTFIIHTRFIQQELGEKSKYKLPKSKDELYTDLMKYVRVHEDAYKQAPIPCTISLTEKTSCDITRLPTGDNLYIFHSECTKSDLIRLSEEKEYAYLNGIITQP